MLVIRLQRTGRRNTPSYRVVVTEKRNPAKNRFLEVVGLYLPAQEPVVLNVQQERVTYWVSKGAIPSDTLARLLIKNGMKGLDKFVVRYAKQKSKGEAEAAPASPPPAAAKAPADAAPPVEQAKEEPKPEEAPAQGG